MKLYGFRIPAIRVDSAEAWHYHYEWTPEMEEKAAQLLSAGAPGAMLDEKQHLQAGREDRVDMEEVRPTPASTPSTF